MENYQDNEVALIMSEDKAGIFIKALKFVRITASWMEFQQKKGIYSGVKR